MGDTWLDQFPLRARGCRLVNVHGDRFKLAGVNWYGASDSKHVVSGLSVRPLNEICEAVAQMGFTVVRLPFSNQMLRIDRVPDGAIDYELNPDLEGLTPLEVYDRVVDGLGHAGVAVVLNNHTTIGMWSGGIEANGLWFQQGSREYTAEAWVQDWLLLAERYRARPHVIGYDLRNEVRPTAVLSTAPGPSWGGGGSRDWSAAAGECARALAATQTGIVVVERICWPQNGLREMLAPAPPWDAWGIPRDRVVLSLHAYSWSGPGFWSPRAFLGRGVGWAVCAAADSIMSRALYGELREEQLAEQMDKEWGFCLDQDLCPVWLSEFGADLGSECDCRWFASMCRYLEQKDADFAYWPLNVGPKPSGEGHESYGMLTNDWRPNWSDERLRALRRLAPRTCLRRKRVPKTPWGHQDRESEVIMRPLSMLMAPWCSPLPGPLVTWPDEAEQRQGMPLCRYLWSSYQGHDSDPGQDARVEIFSNNLQSLKQICIQNGYSGFALHGGKAYMRSAPAEALRSRMQGGFPDTIFWLAEEIRLCARWTDSIGEELEDLEDGNCSPGSASLDSEAEELVEDCRWECLLNGHAGFELDPQRQDWARLLPAGSSETGRGRRPGQLLERTPVRVGLEAHVGRDCFAGENARILRGAKLAECRQTCLEEGYNGFALYRGDAYFRTAAGPVLRQHLVPFAETTFYILTADEVKPADLLGSGGQCKCTGTSGDLLDALLPHLWKPTLPCLAGKAAALESLSGSKFHNAGGGETGKESAQSHKRGCCRREKTHPHSEG